MSDTSTSRASKVTETQAALDVLAVGAHPDDVEITCGGTLAKLARQGYRVGIVDLTDGEPTPGCSRPEIRLQEAQQAAETLGVVTRVVLDLPNRRLFDCFEARLALAKQFRILRPRIVIGFGARTPMASPDHWQAMQITDAAVFYSRLCKWNQYFEQLPVHRIDAQLYFRLPFEPTSLAESSTQFTVDISDTLESKLSAIRCYQTQFPPERQYVLDRVRGAAMLCGSGSGFSAGEMFVTVKPLGVRDLVQTVAGTTPPSQPLVP